MAGLIYGLCALTAFLCGFLLLRAYRATHNKLVLWGGLCFIGLTISNLLLILDKLVVPMVDLETPRHVVSLLSVLVLLYGLIWDSE